MNFLAHLYLSGSNEPLLVGNFIADHIKGSAWKQLPEEIQKGIRLHRFIDDFTDHHPIVEKSKARLRPHFHKYTPVIIDVFYDHYLASLWKNYSKETLYDYSQRVYKIILSQNKILPERTKYILQYMVKENWLVHYETIDGLNKILTGMSKRAKFENKMFEATIWLEKYYSDFNNEFVNFFEELQFEVNKKVKVI